MEKELQAYIVQFLMRHYKVQNYFKHLKNVIGSLGHHQKIDTLLAVMVPDIHAKFHNQQFVMRRAMSSMHKNDLKWRTFKFTLELLEPHWPDSEHGSGNNIFNFCQE